MFSRKIIKVVIIDDEIWVSLTKPIYSKEILIGLMKEDRRSQTEVS